MQGAPNAGISNFIPLIFIFIVFYFLIIRPQQKKQKEHQGMIESLKKNDEIVTAGGVLGTIVNIKENTFVVRVDENVKIEIEKKSIAYIKKAK